MKPILKIVDTQQSEAFQLMKVMDPYFFPSWHFHPELEIMLVQEGAGIRFVGNSMERFQAGDLVLYGSNIPHLYRSDKEYYQKDSPLISKATVIYFKENFLGESFLQVPSMAPIKKLLALSRRGIKFKGNAKAKLQELIPGLEGQKNSIGRIIDLLAILKIMAETKEYDLLLQTDFTKYVSENECERINKVYQFIIDHYTENPTLDEVSDIANMSATAFCRFFKSHTQKTYTQFLNDIKIDNACRLLLDKKMSISQICFETGFNNFTHFNSQFKKIIGITPKQYQATHLNR
ncbi:AraC family transcriptional regulator [Haliscomenobacter hydrossis]|uniref:Transcriptional regulator, AraC family n=1 Tax=Haliscomenobacter hydrossis (strain ATCC 27775 / DSM 1100 / LMG 10767 / O) TaxID=760192 RepID=F4L8B9_HALH1|nr:AraC family transcriptional regulator [Haliscomenobacter hydrossis]AEE54627.1 transcriptional regulator, AraC family [Haliscomenobacter hydrossis DSM 1100]